MDTIKCILGEAKEEMGEPEEKRDKPIAPAKPQPEAPQSGGDTAPEDSEVDELANLWTTGNKDNVAQRFMSMDNETAVKVVFAIGREGALELARMVDLMIEQSPAEGEEGEGEGSTEPVSITPPEGHESDYVGQITGKPMALKGPDHESGYKHNWQGIGK